MPKTDSSAGRPRRSYQKLTERLRQFMAEGHFRDGDKLPPERALAESDLDLARELCDKLGAGLACSRPLTEGVNWLPTELYVGVSGLMLSPKAYVACGISGQMQHMVGCNRAGTMFAINKDKNAPVFKQCDYGIVGDIKDVLPKLAAAL